MERILRTYERTARVEHWCDSCCRHIMPGDRYEASVRLTESHGLIVFKYHVHPACEPPKEPESHEALEDLVKKAG
jgi:hypothetical protein